MPEKKVSHSIFKWLFIVVAIFFILGLLTVIGFYIFEIKYTEKIYPGVALGNTEFSGLSIAEAQARLNEKINNINQNGIPYRYRDKTATLYPVVSSVESDLAYEIITFDIDNTALEMYAYGRRGSFFDRLRAKIKAFWKEYKFKADYTLNPEELEKFLHENFGGFETPAADASLEYETNSYDVPTIFNVKDETYGQILDREIAGEELHKRMAWLETSEIRLMAIIDYPEILKKDALNIGPKAQDILSRTPVKLTYKYNSWPIYKNQLAQWLTLKNNQDLESKDKVIVGIDPDISRLYLEETIALKINKEPVEGKFEINNGKVAEFQASQDGIELNIETIISDIETLVLSDEELRDYKLELSVIELKSYTQTENINDIGIKEIIGVGHSSFAGSPKNRRHNIAVGAAAVNGTLIPPGEEFSLLTTLGDINAKTGYLTELVIKEGKTIPEYGGGLCQIGTTVFRGTVDSGLPVTMRRNHSYRVSYYEPAGTDATIYDPWPDYRFKNDTEHHVLIQSRIEGDDLYFEYWGTNDGRIATQTKPTIYNITRPAPTKIIETLNLEPGVKKCTEHAHNGADAYFDYTVTYADGTLDETRFKSHYVPWREVCLLGVEELTEEKEKTATSTEEITANEE